jgi:hypothetical protein
MMEETKLDKANLRYQLQSTMERKSSRKRKVNRLVTALCIICVGLAIIRLGSILFEAIKKWPFCIKYRVLDPASRIYRLGELVPLLREP